MQEKEDQKVVFVSLSIHRNLEHEEHTQKKQKKNKTKINLHKRMDNQTPFAVPLMIVMDLLDTNLEGKVKLYKDVALSNIFMMNNGHYILQKINGSAEIYSVIGDTWCQKRSLDLRQYRKNYQRDVE